MASPRCESTRKDGQPCQAPALVGNGHCFTHSPDHAEAASAARHRGLVNGNKIKALKGCRPALNDMPGLVKFTAKVINDTYDLKLPYDVARTVLYGLSIQRQLIESGSVAERLEALEARLNTQGGRKWA
jgi:hypothetical protein